MNKLFLSIIFFSFCFSGLRIGADINTEVDVELVGEGELEIGLLLGYESENDEKINFGLEYLFPTDFDGGTGEASMITIYSKYDFFKDDKIIFSGKFGYSIPDIDDNSLDWSVDGGLMFGFEAKYNNISFSYSVHNAELEVSDGSYSIELDLDITRFCIYYSF